MLISLGNGWHLTDISTGSILLLPGNFHRVFRIGCILATPVWDKVHCKACRFNSNLGSW